MRYYLLFSVLLFLLTGCNPDDKNNCSHNSSYHFMLVDDEYPEVDLTLEPSDYHPDSIRLEVDNQEIILGYFQSSRYTYFVFDGSIDLSIYNDSLYFLYLNFEDTDTLQINATQQINPCNGQNYSSINKIIHNGNDTLKNQLFYKILK